MVNATTKAGQRLGRKLGASISAGRKARKWSQEDLAERLGVASETISRFERGATLPSLVTLQRLGQLLKVPLAELVAESSLAPEDQAAVMAGWMVGLREDQREYVVSLVKGACDHFRRSG